MVELPTPRDPAGTTYHIALVCLGNICRSPMAHVVLEQKLKAAGLADRVTVESAGTGTWHLGEPMDKRAADTLTAAGYDASRHRARQVVDELFTTPDLVLVMDDANMGDVRSLAPDDFTGERLMMFRAFDPELDSDDLALPDPFYGGQRGFVDVLEVIERTTDALVDRLAAALA